MPSGSGTVGRVALIALAAMLAVSRVVSDRFGQGSAPTVERGRGDQARLDAATPSWKTILWQLFENISAHRVLAVAAGVTFYALLAIFPGLAALVALYGLFADPSSIGQHLDELANFIPGGAAEVVGEQVNRIASQGTGRLGLTFLISLAVSLWSANAGMKALFDALNVVHGETEKRGVVRLNLISLGFTLIAIVVLLLAIAAVVVAPAIMNYLGIAAEGWLLALARWPLMFVVVALVLAYIYRFGPSHTQTRWRWITWGSALAAFAWLAGSILFSWYVANFGNYNKTYGSLGAVVGFMTWIWLSVTVKLVGAELDAVIEQCARDGARPGE
jgi:membrane protein